MKIGRKRMSYSINELISDGGVCRTAPATPGLLKRIMKTNTLLKGAWEVF